MTIGDIAGLIQAGGSIAAIVAAFWIGNAQGRLAIKMRQADRLDRYSAIGAVLAMAYERAQSLQSEILMLPMNDAVKLVNMDLVAKLRVTLTAIDGLTVDEIASAEIVVALLEAKMAIKHIGDKLPGPAGMFPNAFFTKYEGDLASFVAALDWSSKSVRLAMRRLEMRRN
ncbi:hypothetical protein POK33_12710 [Burkholderia cenocepacia]|uniref:hypothetical protein n=1 Tax=Burkholderia cenocepacia TaxID=95486 RepID=UPI0023B9EC1A|nr:hypothetical protein [Burkholderia cenocepacia]MDF0501579.1 hypothetical protein [Burkholderia cenocepacia]